VLVRHRDRKTASLPVSVCEGEKAPLETPARAALLRGGWRPNQATPQQADQDRGLFLETGDAGRGWTLITN